MISPDTPISKVLSALASAGKTFTKQGNGYSACCPAHEDRSPSLSVSEGDDGRVLVKCFAGCSSEEICAALGLTLADLFEPSRESSPRYQQPAKQHASNGGKRFSTLTDAIADWKRKLGTPAQVWHYHNSTGEIVAAAIRFNQADGGKEFRPVSRDGSDWILKAPASPRPLHRLHELASLPPEARVYVCEGEKAADAACELGLPATTSFGGSQAANLSDWTPLAGRDVVILPDHDAAGKKYGDAVKSILAGLNPRPTLRIVNLPDLPEGGDIVEFIAARTAAGDSATIIRDTVDELAESVPVVCLDDVSQEPASPTDKTSRLISRRVCDVALEPLEWLWPNRVPLGKVTLLAGDPGLGKSFLTCDMAARVSKGAAWPDNELPQPVGSVIIFNCEDGLADTIRPRLEKADADLTKIVAIEGVHVFDPKTENVRQRGFSLAVDLPRLAEELAKLADSRLVVIDPVSAYLGDADSHKNADVRALLAPLAELAERHRVAVVLVNHLSKSTGAKAIYRSMGSIGFAAAARAVWHVAKAPDNETRRLMLPAKMNLASNPTGLAYCIDDGAVRWEADPVHMTADELLANETKAAAGFRESRKSEAAEWLGERLSDGPVPSKDVFREGKEAGFGEKTLRAAFESIGGKPSKSAMDGPWYWSLRSNPTAAERASPRASSKAQASEDATNLPKLPNSQNEASSPSSANIGDEPTSK